MFTVRMVANDQGPVPPWLLDSFANEGIAFSYHECATPGEVVAVAADGDVVWAISPLRLLTAESAGQLGRCLAFLRSGSGTDNVDVTAATAAGIVVANTPDAVTEATSEHGLALMLCCARRVMENDRLIRDGRWDRSAFPRTLLYGSTVGVVGFGRIGRRLAEKAAACGARVIVHDPGIPDASVAACGMEPVALDHLLGTADFVSLHVPLSAGTRHLVGERELRAMKRSAYLINVARGPVVDQRALCEALAAGWIAGAGLDVVEEHPDPDSPLRRLPNVVLTPHIGGGSDFSRAETFRLAGETIIDLKHGRWPRSVVNPDVVPRRPLAARGEARGAC